VEPHDDEITLKLELKPGTTFNTSEIAACLDTRSARMSTTSFSGLN
jgi:hypothetical protein